MVGAETYNTKQPTAKEIVLGSILLEEIRYFQENDLKKLDLDVSELDIKFKSGLLFNKLVVVSSGKEFTVCYVKKKNIRVLNFVVNLFLSKFSK